MIKHKKRTGKTKCFLINYPRYVIYRNKLIPVKAIRTYTRNKFRCVWDISHLWMDDIDNTLKELFENIRKESKCQTED